MIEQTSVMARASSTLSAAGAARRDAMLGELQGAMTRRVRRRRAIKAATGAGALVLTCAAVWIALIPSRRAPSAVPGERETPAVAMAAAETELPAAPKLAHVEVVEAPGTAGSSIVIVQTDPQRLSKYMVGAAPSENVEILRSDLQLMDALARTGNTYGLIRAGVSVSVVCYSCPVPAPSKKDGESTPAGGSSGPHEKLDGTSGTI